MNRGRRKATLLQFEHRFVTTKIVFDFVFEEMFQGYTTTTFIIDVILDKYELCIRAVLFIDERKYRYMLR